MAKVDYLPDVKILEHDKFLDHRGELYTIWKDKDTPNLKFNHDKIALSNKNVLRGLHTDKSWKLITCVYGKIQLIVVDYKVDSKNYLDYLDIVIDASEDLVTSVLVPPGFMNGHLVLSEQAVFHYKWSYDGNYPDVSDQMSIKWSDPKLSIKWLTDNPILSDRDRNTPLL